MCENARDLTQTLLGSLTLQQVLYCLHRYARLHGYYTKDMVNAEQVFGGSDVDVRFYDLLADFRMNRGTSENCMEQCMLEMGEMFDRLAQTISVQPPIVLLPSDIAEAQEGHFVRVIFSRVSPRDLGRNRHTRVKLRS